MKINNIITFTILIGIMSSPIYAKNDKSKGKRLPPGLQKKAMKGKPLPPGWQKKLEKGKIMDRNVYQQSQIIVPIDRHGLITVRIEGKLVRLHQATREIINILK